jgi:hypothetical protein
MDASLKETLRRRAGFRCEYCHLPEAIAELPFQFDHIVAAQHGGMATKTTSPGHALDATAIKAPTYRASTQNWENSRAFLTLAPTPGLSISSGTMQS